MKHVIIGAGPSGVIAAETLRKLDSTSSVIMVGDESEEPYSRMALPYYLTNKIEESGTYLRKDADHYSDKKIDVIRDRVSKIDTKAKSLTR